MLTFGSNTNVLVLEKQSEDSWQFSQVCKIGGVSDNVSCVRTIYVTESKQVLTLFGTFNGRLNAQVVKQIA